MKAILLALAGVLALSGAAQADRFSAISGAKLIEICTGRDKGVVGDCTAYIDGISDAASFYQSLRPRDGSKGAALPEYICVPASATGVQLREAVVAWAKKNQGDMGRQASGVVLRALRDTFPCAGGRAG